MKKFIVLVSFICIFPLAVFSDGLNWAIGYDMSSVAKNTGLNSSAVKATDPYLDVSWAFENGIFAAFRYDHISIDDCDFEGINAKAVAAVPSLNAGWAGKFMEDKLALSLGAGCGFAFVRYRLNVTDSKARSIAPYGFASLYYQVFGHFYAGLDAGYRVINAQFENDAKTRLNLSGIFYGLGLKHIY